MGHCRVIYAVEWQNWVQVLSEDSRWAPLLGETPWQVVCVQQWIRYSHHLLRVQSNGGDRRTARYVIHHQNKKTRRGPQWLKKITFPTFLEAGGGQEITLWLTGYTWRYILAALGSSLGDRWICILPPFYCLEPGCSGCSPSLGHAAGSQTFWMEAYEPGQILQLSVLLEQRATFQAGPLPLHFTQKVHTPHVEASFILAFCHWRLTESYLW